MGKARVSGRRGGGGGFGRSSGGSRGFFGGGSRSGGGGGFGGGAGFGGSRSSNRSRDTWNWSSGPRRSSSGRAGPLATGWATAWWLIAAIFLIAYVLSGVGD